MKRSCLLVVLIMLGLGAADHALAQDDEPVSSLKFVVIRDYNGKPVKNAAVVMHPVNKGKQSYGGLELKTDTEGHASFEGVPYGSLRVQVLAQGFQTFGDDYDINKPEMEITVRLKRPQGQYSIYDNPSQTKPSDKDKPAENKDQKPPDEKKPQ